MFGYNIYSVISNDRNDTGIICDVQGSRFRVMFETINNGVEFVWYPLSAISKYQVIG